jgi:very-short-patch-repair endonuclease
MEKLDISVYNWKYIQEKHNNGAFLKDLGVTRKAIEQAIEKGLFVKIKNTRKWSEEEKIEISKRRKKWLSENPEKHPWKKNTKFKSIPCEFLKNNLKELNIEFFEEVTISKEKNYSADILIPSKNLIIEVNGNQHYDKLGKLIPYYQERHDFISALGWKILEIHYSLAFNIDFCKTLIIKEPEKSEILPFYKKEKRKNVKYGNREDYLNAKRLEYEEKNKEKIILIQNSNIEFSNFGWVSKVSKILNIKTQKVSLWMKTFMPDFYENQCFKKKK